MRVATTHCLSVGTADSTFVPRVQQSKRLSQAMLSMGRMSGRKIFRQSAVCADERQRLMLEPKALAQRLGPTGLSGGLAAVAAHGLASGWWGAIVQFASFDST